MPDPLALPSGRWWRMTRYELRQGTIMPAPGARCEAYDPWAQYQEIRSHRQELPAPYQSLIKLLNTIRFSADETLDAASEVALLAWCTKYGLLGILPHQAHLVHLFPRWEMFPLLADSPRLSPVQHRYVRTPTGWRHTVQGPRLESLAPIQHSNAHAHEGKLVTADDWPHEWGETGVWWQDLRSGKWTFEPLARTWSRFFSEVPESEYNTFPYPMPLTEAFWPMYGEPLPTFLDGARALRDALRGFAHLNPFVELSDDDRRAIVYARDCLQTLTAAVNPALDLCDDGMVRPQWVSPSVLASFAMMAHLDLAGQRRVLACELCGTVFLSGAWQARYCSPTCRHTAQKRAYRARQEGVAKTQSRRQHARTKNGGRR